MYSGKIGGETSPSGASSYFSSSMQSAYGQQGKHIYNLLSSSMLKSEKVFFFFINNILLVLSVEQIIIFFQLVCVF